MSLSDEEILQVVGNRADIGDAVRIARAIEAKIETKLREQEPFGYYWNFKDMEEGIITGQHFVEGEAEEQGYIPLFEHPAPIPEGYQLVPIEPTEAMVHAGQEIAHDLITANCCKSINGLGGGKTWQEFKDGCKNIELCEMYLNDEIDSVEAIYRAMLAAARGE